MNNKYFYLIIGYGIPKLSNTSWLIFVIKYNFMKKNVCIKCNSNNEQFFIFNVIYVDKRYHVLVSL